MEHPPMNRQTDRHTQLKTLPSPFRWRAVKQHDSLKYENKKPKTHHSFVSVVDGW